MSFFKSLLAWIFGTSNADAAPARTGRTPGLLPAAPHDDDLHDAPTDEVPLPGAPSAINLVDALPPAPSDGAEAHGDDLAADPDPGAAPGGADAPSGTSDAGIAADEAPEAGPPSGDAHPPGAPDDTLGGDPAPGDSDAPVDGPDATSGADVGETQAEADPGADPDASEAHGAHPEAPADGDEEATPSETGAVSGAPDPVDAHEDASIAADDAVPAAHGADAHPTADVDVATAAGDAIASDSAHEGPDSAHEGADSAPLAPDSAHEGPDGAPLAPDSAHEGPDSAHDGPDGAPIALNGAAAAPIAALNRPEDTGPIHADPDATEPPGQSIPLPGQVPNSAGGAAWAAADWTRLRRFLILGTSGGSYYASEAALTDQNTAVVRRCLAVDGPRTVAEIVAVSEAGRAPKVGPALTALAIAASFTDGPADRAAATRKAALAALPAVARTGSHLFTFAEQVNARRGWGRGLREAVARWYQERPARELTYQAIKYQQREGWSHRDLLRLSHPTAPTFSHSVLFHWVTQGWPGVGPEPHPNEDVRQLWAMEKARRATSADEVRRLILDHRLPREAVPTQHLTDAGVWAALLEDMPVTALIRNLPTLTRVGLLAPRSAATALVVERLGERGRLRAGRVHPLTLLSALRTYASGRSLQGDATWIPVPEVVAALDSAFYLAFDAVIPSNKRWMLGLDVSGSMMMPTAIPGVSARDIAAATAMVTHATEPEAQALAFTDEIVPFPLHRGERLDAVISRMNALPFGPTDCAQPMLYALERRIPVDTFAIYTDSETWFGQIHPARALEDYRQAMGIPAKLVVVGAVSNGFSIADPNDPGMLDVVGFDTSAPALIADFARGDV
jgi:60 kDa SS-A/Ro ribonucleoprotein